MIGQLTNAGVAALQGSQLVNIPLAKLGDGVNYIPEITDTDIHGNEVYRTQPSDPLATNANTVRWSVFLDVNVGPFQFGEVGLYLPNGDLFALFAANELIDKINVGGANKANEVNLLIFVTMVGDNYVIWLDLASTNNQLQVARANSPDQLPQPQNAYPNIYIMPGATADQQSILAVTDRQGLWAFCGYDNANTMHGTVLAFDSTSVTIAGSEYTQDMSPDYFGQLILQFTTGNLYGACRYIKQANASGSNWRLTFNTPLAITPVVGDTFSIQSRNPLTIDGGNLPVATRTAAGVVIPRESLTLDGAGNIGVDWTKLTLNGTPAVQTGDNGALSITISEVGRTGQYSDLINIPPLYAPVLATPTVRGGVKIAPNTGLYLDADEVLQLDLAGHIPQVVGLIAPAEIGAGADLNASMFTVPGLFWTLDSTGLSNAPSLPAGSATLEVVPISAGTAPGACIQRWTQVDGGLASRLFNGTTWSTWVNTSTQLPATKTSLGLVQIGTNITVSGGLIDVPIATQAAVGLVKGGPVITVALDGTLEASGLLTASQVGIQGGVAGYLSTDPDSPPADQNVSDYTYGRLPEGQLPLGALYYFLDWDASTNSGTYTSFNGLVHTVTASDGGMMTDSWTSGGAQSITVPANGKVFRVSTAGTTSLDGNSSWAVNDLAVAIGSRWIKISNTGGGSSGVTSLNGANGAVTTVNGTGITVTTDTGAKTLTFDANVQQSANDTTAGRMLTVGNAFGIGADNALGTADLNSVILPGLYSQPTAANATTASNYPGTGLTGSLIVSRASATEVNQIYMTGGALYVRGLVSSTWSAWSAFLTTTAAPVSSFNAAKALALTDAGIYWRCTAATGVTVTVPTNASVAFPISTEIHFRQAAAGAITLSPAGGVTINPPRGGSLVTGGAGDTITLKKVGVNEWDLFGVTA